MALKYAKNRTTWLRHFKDAVGQMQ